MRIFHLASFTGNIGDEANHIGFRQNLKKYVCSDIDVHECEMRDFYRSWGIRRFDEGFVAEVNEYDLLVIGGGNFFEACWDYSATGTTVDISTELFDQITIPVFINGIGFDDFKGCTDAALTRFRAFLNHILRRDNVRVSFRNDGSRALLEKYFYAEELAPVKWVPDGGFFFRPSQERRVRLPEGRRRVGMCLACDMEAIRFGEAGYGAFVRDMAGWCDWMLTTYPDYDLMLVPHIYSDLRVISDVVAGINDRFRRLRVIVSPLLNKRYDAADTVFAGYMDCDVVAAMRFHANVIPIGNGIPTIGLTSYPKHGLLYEELGIPERTVRVNSEGWTDRLTTLFCETIGSLDAVRARYAEVDSLVDANIAEVYSELKDWLAACEQRKGE